MNDFKTVSEELEAGTPPDVLCAMCPWTRTCVEPSGMTQAEYDRQIDKAKVEDNQRSEDRRAEGKPDAGPPIMGQMMTMLALGSQVGSAKLCPVFAARFSLDRALSDSIRTAMREGTTHD